MLLMQVAEPHLSMFRRGIHVDFEVLSSQELFQNDHFKSRPFPKPSLILL